MNFCKLSVTPWQRHPLWAFAFNWKFKMIQLSLVPCRACCFATIHVAFLFFDPALNPAAHRQLWYIVNRERRQHSFPFGFYFSLALNVFLYFILFRAMHVRRQWQSKSSSALTSHSEVVDFFSPKLVHNEHISFSLVGASLCAIYRFEIRFFLLFFIIFIFIFSCGFWFNVHTIILSSPGYAEEWKFRYCEEQYIRAWYFA